MTKNLPSLAEKNKLRVVIRSSGTACSIETVVAALIVAVDDDKGVSANESVTEFLDAIISILSFNLQITT